MPFTAEELANINNAMLDFHMDKRKVYAQNIQAKPMLQAFDSMSKSTLSGGKGEVTVRVKTGQGGLTLAGYTHDDLLTYGNPTGIKNTAYAWKEMFIGMGVTHTELKHDGITVVESDASQSTSEKDGREEHALANLLEEKNEDMAEDYAVSMDSLIHGDGTGDTKAIAGIRAFILDDPSLGTTGGLSRSNVWWRNWAATSAANAAGSGDNAVTSSTSNGGALLQYLQTTQRQLNRYAGGRRRNRCFAGSDWMDAYEKELRANGQYAQTGWKNGDGTVDGAMGKIAFDGKVIEYDPTLDDLGLEKRMYDIDFSRLMLVYMKGEKMKKCSPARPHDRLVLYKGVTTTAVMVTKGLRTSAVIDIA